MQAGLGKTIIVKGHVTASEDLQIEGRVEGTVTLKEHVLTVMAGATLEATILAKSVVVIGVIGGDVEALERIELREGASLTGDLIAPRMVMAEGATLNGTVEMQRRDGR